MVVAVIDGGWRIATVKGLFRNLRGARYRVRMLEVTDVLSEKKEVLAALSRSREEIVAGLAAMRAEKIG
jgi:hypothetical protein